MLEVHGKKKEAWRPKKRFRLAAKKFLGDIDTKMQIGTHFGGTKRIVYDPKAAVWHPKNWRNWAFFTHIGDQGSDNVSGCHAAEYLLLMNWFSIRCFRHCRKNNVISSYKDNGLFDLVLMFLIVLNVFHGPDKDEDMRFVQIGDCMRWFFKKFTCDSSELFRQRVGGP